MARRRQQCGATGIVRRGRRRSVGAAAERDAPFAAPAGLAPRIVNLAEWRAHLLYRLRRQVELTADRALIDLLHEVSGYPAADRCGKTPNVEQEIAVPFRIRTSVGVLSFFSMTTVFGTPVDVMLSELALELFFPADDDTAAAVHRLAADARSAN
jgi:hypothetical protein